MNPNEQLPELNEEQAAVVEAIQRGESVLVTGPAGTGKSTILRHLQSLYRGRLPVTASTGIAAVNVGGVTLHSWAGLGLAKGTPSELAANIRKNERAFSRVVGAERLALDEVSMISAELFSKVDKVFRIVRKVDKPFGGMQLILFGDFLQLPPVERTDENAGNNEGTMFTGPGVDSALFSFQTAAWADAKIRTHFLHRVFRQADPEFADALSQIRLGTYNETVGALLNARFRAEDPDPAKPAVIIHTHNVDVDGINADHLAKLPGEAKRFQAADAGEERGIKLLQKNCLAPTFLELKVGALVMLLTNLELEVGLANGSTGILTRFDPLGRPTVEFFNGQTREVDKMIWEIKEGNRIIATRTQYPLRLAWAITTHKSQGMSLDKVRLHLGKVFECGQAYVALSRVRTKEGLFIASGNKKAIKAHPAALKFYADKN